MIKRSLAVTASFMLLLPMGTLVEAQEESTAVEISALPRAQGLGITYSVQVFTLERLEFHVDSSSGFTPSASTLRGTMRLSGPVQGSTQFDGFTPGETVYIRVLAYLSTDKVLSSKEQSATPCEGPSLQACAELNAAFESPPSVEVQPNGYRVSWAPPGKAVERYEVLHHSGAEPERVVANATGEATSIVVVDQPVWNTDRSVVKLGIFPIRVTAHFLDGTSTTSATAVAGLRWERPRAVIGIGSRSLESTYSGEDTGVRVGELVEVDGSASTDPYNQALSYVWTWGDGTTSSGSRVSHVYAQPGGVTVSLRVTDPYGNYGTTYEDSNLVFNIGASPVQAPPSTFNGTPYSISPHVEAFTFLEGAAMRLNATISNPGKVAGPPVKVRVFAGGNEVASTSVPALLPGGKADLSTGNVVVKSDRSGTFGIKIGVYSTTNNSELEALSFPLGVVHPLGGWVNIQNLTLTPSQVTLGTPIKATVSLWNPGKRSSPPVWIRWSRDDVPFPKETYVEPVQAHEWRNVTGPVWMPGLSTFQVKAAYFLPGQIEEDFMHSTTAYLKVVENSDAELPDLAINGYRFNEEARQLEIAVKNVGRATSPPTSVTISNLSSTLEVPVPSLFVGETHILRLPHENIFAPSVSVNAQGEFPELNDRNNYRSDFDIDYSFTGEDPFSEGPSKIPGPRMVVFVVACIVASVLRHRPRGPTSRFGEP